MDSRHTVTSGICVHFPGPTIDSSPLVVLMLGIIFAAILHSNSGRSTTFSTGNRGEGDQINWKDLSNFKCQNINISILLLSIMFAMIIEVNYD